MNRLSVFSIGLGALLLLSARAEAATPEMQRQPHGIRCRVNGQSLEVSVWSERVLRVRRAAAGVNLETDFPPSLAVIAQPAETKWRLEETDAAWRVVTAELIATVDRASGRVSFEQPDGTLLTRESAAAVTPAKVAGADTFTCATTFSATTGDHFYGLGEWEQLLPGKKCFMEQLNTRTCIPVLQSSRGWGLLWDNAAKTEIQFAADAVAWSSEFGAGVDYYFLRGGDMDGTVAAYRSLTGRAPLLPQWGYGFWFSRNRYKTQAEVLDAVENFRARKIPLDLIIQDYFYWPEGTWGTHEFDAERYPDPAGMIRTLHREHHAKFMAVVWGKHSPMTEQGKALKAVNGLLPPGAWYKDVWDWAGNYQYYDPFNPRARDIFWRQANTALFKLGLDGWWLDAAEPEIRPMSAFHQANTAAGKGARVFNAYPLLHTTTFYEGQRQTTDDKRVVILTRSGFAGQQRNSAVCWSGDIGGGFKSLRQQIELGQNFCAAGVPYWTTDIGGYNSNSTKPENREAFIRWFQWGTFCPVFRVHGDKRQHPWEMGEQVEANIRQYTALRYRLMPYIYSVAARVTRDGYTMMRPLAMDFPGDARALESMQEFMFGPALHIAPVTEPLATNGTERATSNYLPGTRGWFDFWTGEPRAGGSIAVSKMQLDVMPIHVRAGTILPLGPELQYAGEKPADPLELRVYPGSDGRFTLYEDAGDGYAYEHGKFSEIPIEWNNATQTLTVGARTGRFPGMLKERTFRIVLVRPGHGVGLTETLAANATIKYSGKAISTKL